jgi:hypothetical protein
VRIHACIDLIDGNHRKKSIAAINYDQYSRRCQVGSERRFPTESRAKRLAP